jgi:hypothetical protein
MKIRSMRGLEIDMAAVIAKNEGAVAVGNANMNARGDVIGPGGKVIKTRDEIAQEYHRNNPKAVRNVALKDLSNEAMATPVGSDKYEGDFMDPAVAVAAIDAQSKARKARKIEDTDD